MLTAEFTGHYIVYCTKNELNILALSWLARSARIPLEGFLWLRQIQLQGSSPVFFARLFDPRVNLNHAIINC
jgi:hypothetical protein